MNPLSFFLHPFATNNIHKEIQKNQWLSVIEDQHIDFHSHHWILFEMLFDIRVTNKL
jgi:hypothetical protein